MSIFKILIVLLLLSLSCFCQAQLSPGFYNQTCPDVFSKVRDAFDYALAFESTAEWQCRRFGNWSQRNECAMKRRRLAPALIRLQYLDCFVGGCDASIMLTATPTMESERDSPTNSGLLNRGFHAIQRMKNMLELECPGVVSCADIIVLAARYAVEIHGGPLYEVKLGRRDSTWSHRTAADNLPNYNASLDELTLLFQRKGLTTRDLVALSGAHTVGYAHCRTFRDRIYNSSSDIDPEFATQRKRDCPAIGGDTNLAPLDEGSEGLFYNSYYSNLVEKQGLLATDQVLYGTGASTDSIVEEYAKNSTLFDSDFAAAMIKMGEIGVLTGSHGEIRKFCFQVNS